jgi:hypothetical protein
MLGGMRAQLILLGLCLNLANMLNLLLSSISTNLVSRFITSEFDSHSVTRSHLSYMVLVR